MNREPVKRKGRVVGYIEQLQNMKWAGYKKKDSKNAVAISFDRSLVERLLCN